jgi:hypothetical protein
MPVDVSVEIKKLTICRGLSIQFQGLLHGSGGAGNGRGDDDQEGDYGCYAAPQQNYFPQQVSFHRSICVHGCSPFALG